MLIVDGTFDVYKIIENIINTLIPLTPKGLV